MRRTSSWIQGSSFLSFLKKSIPYSILPRGVLPEHHGDFLLLCSETLWSEHDYQSPSFFCLGSCDQPPVLKKGEDIDRDFRNKQDPSFELMDEPVGISRLTEEFGVEEKKKTVP